MARIIIDNKTRHGKPIVAGTRITVEEVLDMLEQGMTYKEIEEEYGLTKQEIIAAIGYASSLVHGEEVHKVPA